MPFLFPALAAAACDFGILYLGHRSYLLEQQYSDLSIVSGIGVSISDDDDNTTTTILGAITISDNNLDDYDGGIGDDVNDNIDNDDARRVYHYGYIIILASIRLFLLFVPLPYHSYHGKALRCPILYRLFYCITLGMVFIHALTLIMVDPGSLSSLVEAVKYYNNSSDIHHILVTRSLWVAIILTISSTLSHVTLFFHVRSTAPSDAEFFVGQRRPKVLLYYAKEKNQSSKNKYESNQENTEREGLLSSDAMIENGDGPIIRGLSVGEHKHQQQHQQTLDDESKSSNHAFQDISNKLMMEIQVRLRTAKGEWTKRLEEYTQNPIIHKATSAATAAAANIQHQHHQSTSNNISHSNLSPFRVVLELFAGDNNNNNDYVINRLDAVYDRDDGAALLLFVPQLLSFLLHGAYESSYQLEEWILNTCRKNLFFAHQCYWFLRAWSLEVSNIIGTTGANRTGGGSNNGRLSHSSSLTSFETQEVIQSDNNIISKLLPEERAVIEELMRKIMKCGEEQARLLHFGTTADRQQHLELSTCSTTLFLNDNNVSTSSCSSPIKSSNNQNYASSSTSFSAKNAAMMGLIPINPSTGIPSRTHYECLTANRRYGFLPLDNEVVVSNSYNRSILDGDDPCATSYFDSTPVFMDALVTIADGLFKVPRELRNDEFKKQLNLLEVEALPCNEIYIPLQNLHHRVWRIVSDESIAISTKERVPCIICLEVVDYTQQEQRQPEQNHESNNNEGTSSSSPNRDIRKLLKQRSERVRSTSERDMVDSWRYSRRDPHRRESAFGRLTQGMGKIPDKMKSTMQEQINRLKHIRLETDMNDFWSIHVPETLSFDTDDSDNSNNNKDGGHDNDKKSGTHIDILTANNKVHFCDEPIMLSTDIERGDKNNNNNIDVESTATLSSQIPQQQPPLSPESPRASISLSQGAMGQWTKSPGRKTFVKSTMQISDAVVEELVVPTTTTRRRSYHSVNNTNTSRRRLSSTNTGESTENGGGGGRQISYNTGVGNIITESESNNCHYSDDDNNEDSNNDIGTPPSNKPPTKPPPVVFKENWKEKEDRLRSSSAYGNHPGWRLLPILIKSNDDLRQEQLASQLIYRMALILARERIPVWLCPNEIIALEASGGIIEAIPDTISIASLKKNDPDYTDLKGFFDSYFCDTDSMADAKANFCESLAAYSIVCFLLQIKDRHNGNILLDNRGHLIHIDFGFFFLSSPGKNTGFESAPFKLTREWVNVLGGPDSHLFAVFRTLCYRTFIALRKNCHEIILLVEMLQLGNEELMCFRGRPDDAIRELRQRFRLDLNDRACLEYVNALIDESLENWRTNWYDRYQRYCVGVL
jgi:hypothetical protein